MKYFIVDVFCRGKYSGNQLAVIVTSEELSTERMQKIAREFNFSEVTFIIGGRNNKGSYRVRIFTPQHEIPFAGHPTLGTAYIIRNEIETAFSGDRVVLDLNVGEIPVTFDDGKDIQWMRQIEPEFGLKHNAEAIAPILGVTVDDIDPRFPVQAVSTGLEFLIIPLKTLAAVKGAYTDVAEYRNYFTGREPKPLFIFCPETYDSVNRINCRMFAQEFGITEDPATGSANGCLAGYLSRYQYFGSPRVDVTVEQGYEIDRESLLHIKVNRDKESYNIQVGGKVVMAAQGNLV